LHAGNNQARKRARIQAANESETDDDASVESTSDEDRSDDGSASGSEDSDQVGSSEAESVDRFMPKGKGKGKEAARRKAAVLAAALAAANAKGKRKHKHASAERRPTAADFADVLAGEKRVPEPCVHKVSFTDCPLASAAARQSDSDEEHDAGAGAVAAPPADAPAAVARAPRAPAPAVIAEVPLAVVPQAPAAPAPVAVAPAPPVPALAADAVPNAAIAAGGAGNEAAAPALALSAPALKTLGDAVIEAFTACVTEAELASVKNADGRRPRSSLSTASTSGAMIAAFGKKDYMCRNPETPGYVIAYALAKDKTVAMLASKGINFPRNLRFDQRKAIGFRAVQNKNVLEAVKK